MNKYIRPESAGKTAFPIAQAGYPLIYMSAFITAILAMLGFTIPTLATLVITLCICMFFRDPDRLVPKGDHMVVSPADGKIIIVRLEKENPFLPGPCVKISIFMTVFNVHVNRAPHEGTVDEIEYSPGKFFSAHLDKAGRHNEQNAILIRTESGVRYCVVQIAGLVARRIICHKQKGDRLTRGQRFGLICFGSRLDVYLPSDASPDVKVGDKVKAGTSILGYLS